MIKTNTNWVINDDAIQLCSAIQPSYADDFLEYKQFILENVSFTQALDHFKLRYEDCNNGKYTHKMICPFKFHKNGRERTGSFRFNNNEGIFTCFGCNSGGTLLDFLFLLAGVGDEYNLRRLAGIGGLIKDGILSIPADYISRIEEFREKNYDILFNIGVFLRKYLSNIRENKGYIKECEWVDRTLIKVDEYFSSISEEDLNTAKKIFEDVKISVERRLIG